MPLAPTILAFSGLLFGGPVTEALTARAVSLPVAGDDVTPGTPSPCSPTPSGGATA